MEEVTCENQGSRLMFSAFLSSWTPLWKTLWGHQEGGPVGSRGAPLSTGRSDHALVTKVKSGGVERGAGVGLPPSCRRAAPVVCVVGGASCKRGSRPWGPFLPVVSL